MRLFRRLFRLCRLVPHVLRGVWDSATILPPDRPPRGEAEWHTVRRWFVKALQLVGVEVRLHGTPAQGATLFVSNHVSWLDIGALNTVIDAGFIGKSELRDWPVLGFLIARGGTVFIERGGAGAAQNATREMVERLGQGDRVAVFPEGTTTRGTMRRFHPRLFEAARVTGVPVQPVALRYDNPAAPFVDDVSFLSHLWGILGERRITVDVHLLTPVETTARDRRTIARTAESSIRQRLEALPGEETVAADRGESASA
jgi:1-acyl-sn-glycerol-3-phosphate acyltransferase